MELRANLESVLITVNNFINIDAHRQKYAEHFSYLTKIIFNELRNNEVFSYMFNGFQLGGSYGDNVKVTIPNEFDLVFHIKLPERSLIKVKRDDDLPGNVILDLTAVLKKIQNEKQHNNNLCHLMKWLDNDQCLKVERFQSFLQSSFEKALTKIDYHVVFKGKTANLRYKREGPAHTIKVCESPSFKYSIDFVPGILMSASQNIFPKVKGDWEAIPKPTPINNSTYNSFRISFYRQEQDLISNKHQLKNAYRMMKKFRDAKSNMLKMKSYYIKTLFLFKAEQEDISYWRKALTHIIVDMFKMLEDSLRREELPFFWDRKLNLYDRYNSRLLREMLSCVESCRKTLEKAAKGLTLPLQNRTYCIFLTTDERDSLERKGNKEANGISDQINGDPCPVNENPGPDSSQWSCVVM